MGREPFWRARARLHASSRTVASTAALTLLAPIGLAAPAQAALLEDLPDLGGVLDPVTAVVTPTIGQGAAGRVDFLGATVCSSDGTVTKVCDALPLGDLGGVASVLLTAVPTDPDAVAVWDTATCPAVVANVCTVPLTDLSGSTPLAPVVSFLPLPGGEGSGAPDTKITSPAPNRLNTEHTFTFESAPKADTVTFQCRLQVTYKGTPPAGAATGHDWRWCESGMTYRPLADGDYVFGVRAVDEAGAQKLEDPTPATQAWTVATPPQSPDTRIVSGARAGAWVLGNAVSYRFRSTVAGSEFQCDLGARTYPCDAGVFTIRKPAAGSHLFQVYALANKTRDFTPAKRTFHVPLDDRRLKPVKSWVTKTAKGHFKNTVRVSKVRGAALVTPTQRFRRVVLVADKAPGHGTVRVYWNKRLLKQVSLSARRPMTRQVIPVKTFAGGLRKGRLRIVVVSSGKVVRIDGLGVATR